MQNQFTRVILSCLVFHLSLVTMGQGGGMSFSQSTGTYTAISGGTILASATFNDNNYSVTLPSPFTFKEVSYTQVTVNTNGWISLAAITNTIANPISTTAVSPGIISPFGVDLVNASAGSPEIRWQQIGDEIIFQWQHVRRVAAPGAESISFQARLNTLTGTIQFVYGAASNVGTSSTWPQVGIRAEDNSFPGNIYNRLVNTSSSWNASLQGTANTSTCRFSAVSPATFPASGQTYTWTPVDCALLTCSSNIAPADGAMINSASVTLSWTSVANAARYKVYFGTSLPLSLFTTVTGTSTTINDLLPNTVYYWYVSPASFNCTVSGCASTVTSFNSGCVVNGCVTNISPANGASLTSSVATLSWNSIAGATLYDVYFGTVNPPTTATRRVAGTSTSFVLPNNSYYWYVFPGPHCASPAICNANSTQFAIANSTMAANDICATAFDLAGSLGMPSSFTSASFELNTGFCHYGSNKDVWFRFKALATTAQVSVTGGGSPCFDPAISAYSGNCNSLTCLGSDDAGSCTTTNSVSLNNLIPGNIYYIRITTFDATATTGQFTMNGTNIGSITLPLQFIDFTGRQKNRVVLLEWKTTGENNTSYFDVERSRDGNVFEKIGQVPSLNTAGAHTYSFSDNYPLTGYGLYRVRQVDIDQRFSFSKVIRVDESTKQPLLQVWPNPAAATLTASFNSLAKKINVQLVDASGRIVWSYQQENTPQLRISLGTLAPGAYYLQVTDGIVSGRARFIKL